MSALGGGVGIATQSAEEAPWSLREAVNHIGADMYDVRLWRAWGLQIQHTHIDEANIPRYIELEMEFERQILKLLIAGNWTAKGFRAGAAQIEDLPREWWKAAEIDIAANTAAAYGVTINGIMITPRRASGMSVPAALDTTLPDPAAGLPFRFAMAWYGDDDTVAAYRRLVLRHPIKRGTPGALNEGDLGALNSWQIAIVEDQTQRLRSGAQRARAFRLSSLVLEDIPKEWWQQVRVDVERNTAESNGTILSGILIYPNEQHVARKEPPAAETPLHTDPSPLRQKKRGPKSGLTNRAGQAMTADIQAGKVTLEALHEMKQNDLAYRYGVRSRDTASKAFRIAAQNVGISNPDK